MHTPQDHPLAVDREELLAADPGLWEGLRGKRILVTGGTGFFGCWLLEAWLAARERFGLDGSLCVLSRDPAAFRARVPHLGEHPALSFIQGDQTDFDFPAGRFHYVIHAAVEYGAPLETLERNLLGTRRVLDFAARSGAERVLFTSSGAVYGPQDPLRERLEEEDPVGAPWLSAAGAYGEAKRASELLGTLRGERDGFAFLIARGFAFLGPHLPLGGSGAAGCFLRDALEGRPIQVRGDGRPLRSYLYGSDLSLWLWTILLRGVHGRPCNVGGREALPVGELARRVRDLVHPNGEVQILGRPEPGPAPRYLPSVERAEAELGLRARVDLDTAIRRSAAWHRWRNRG